MSVPPPKKDFAESHGMQHGSFRDYLKTHGEAKTAEQRATERAVAQARAAAVAKNKVASMQAAGRQLDGKTMSAELEAQAARARAMAHLDKNACGPSQFELTGVRAKVASEDNTLEVVAKRKAKKLQQEQDKAQGLKEQLLRQQQSLRSKMESAGAGAAGSSGSDERGAGSGGGPAPLPPNWKEVPSGEGDSYFWNEVTGETTWERPKGKVVAAAAAASSSSASSSSSSSLLPAGWKEVKHASTGQVMYEHETTKERRWEKPTSEADASDIKAADHGVGGAKSSSGPLKFSFGGRGMMMPRIVAGGGGGGDAAKRKSGCGEGGGGGVGGGGADAKKTKFDWQKKHNKIDPMDPTGSEGGKGQPKFDPNTGERMADSTASGPLFQQRPYPAPGSVLRGGK